MKLVSVIIPCHNYGRYLYECVGSIVGQFYKNIEVIIVNSGSTDNTKIIAEGLQKEYKNVRLLNIADSGGPSIPRNIGIENSNGDYIVCLDSDDKVSENYVSESVRLLEANAGYSICYSNLKHFGNMDSYIINEQHNNENIVRTNYIPVAALYKRECWCDTGGYRENVGGYEDWDFWVNCYLKGHLHIYSSRSVFYYRRHSDAMLGDCVKEDIALKAKIILNNSTIFSKLQIDWARAVVDPKNRQINIYDPGLGLIPLTQELILNNKEKIKCNQSEFMRMIAHNVENMS